MSDDTLVGRSLIKQLNNMGPSTEPGVTGAASDCVPSIMTLCVRLVRESPIHGSVGPRTPHCSTFRSIMYIRYFVRSL